MLFRSVSQSRYTASWDEVGLDSLLRHVVPLVPEVPHSMALDRVRQRYIEFARKSSLIVTRQYITLQKDVQDYTLTPPKGYEVFQVLGFQSVGYSFVDYWRGYRRGLWGQDFEVVDNTTIKLSYAPSVDNPAGIEVILALLPTECATTVLKSIATPYGAGIAKGAVADLLLIPNKPWTNGGLASKYELEFNRVVQSARNLGETNRQTGPVRPFSRRVV